jgi:hypothetical protein
VDRLRTRFANQRFRELPETTVYPFNYQQVSSIFEECRDVPKETVGIHWFGGNPLAQKWNNLLTRESLGKYGNTFTKYARLT